MTKVKLIAATRFDGEEGPVKRGQEIAVDEARAADLIRRGLAAREGEKPLPLLAGIKESVLPVGDAAGPVLTPDAQAKQQATTSGKPAGKQAMPKKTATKQASTRGVTANAKPSDSTSGKPADT